MKRQSESSDSRTRVVSAVELMAGSTRAKARAANERVFVIFMGILTCSIRERQRKGKSSELTQVCAGFATETVPALPGLKLAFAESISVTPKMKSGTRS